MFHQSNIQGDSICEGESMIFTATPAGLDNYEFRVNSYALQSSSSNSFTSSSLINNQNVAVLSELNTVQVSLMPLTFRLQIVCMLLQ